MKFVVPVVVSATALLATSCATFPGNQLPHVADTSATGVKKVPLTYSMQSSHELIKGRETPSTAAVATEAAGPLVDSMNGSGRFSSVRQGQGGAIHVDVNMLNHGNGPAAMASGFLTGFSLFTIPGFATDHYKLTAKARSSSGQSHQYVLEDRVTTVFWLPMIVAAPFNSPQKVVPEVQENMYRNLIQNMENDGLIPRASR
ncbi:hypothetical protein [Haloferula sargassicola]|uniref:Lipoprotein n=1 Tax=Haloferula sargassicola TaxID=490096 RepID=A0ABP9UKJ0_9BACT